MKTNGYHARYFLPSIFFSIILVAAGITWAHRNMTCGLDFMDESYEILNARDPLNCPLAPLPAWLGHCLLHHDTPNLLAARYLAYGITLLSIFIVALCLASSSKNAKDTARVFLSAGIAVLLSGAYPGAWLYGWDIFSNAALSITLAWLFILLRRRGFTTIFIAGALAGAATLCRVPDALVLPAVLAVAAYSSPGRRIKACITAIGAYIIVVAGFLLWAYGSPGNYINAIAANSMGAHGAGDLIRNTFSGLVWFVPLLCSTICLFLLVRYSASRFGRRSACFPALSVAGAALLGLVFRLTVWKFTVVEQMAECIVIPLLLYPLFSRRQAHRTTKILALAALWTGLCAVAGSNTGFIKFLSIGMLPVAVALSRPERSRPLGIWLTMMVAVYCCVGAGVRRAESYKDAGAAVAERQITIPSHPMCGIRTTERFANYALQGMGLSRNLRRQGYEVRVLATGLNRYGWALITDTPPAFNRHNWAEESASTSAELSSALQEAITTPHVAVIVPAPFAGELQCSDFAPCDADIIEALADALREEPSGIEGVRLFCGIPRQQ